MRICVFCSSKSDLGEELIATCRSFSRTLAREGHTLVYGGASVGLMGIMANEALAEGGEVVGYLPRGLFSNEVPHRELTKLVIVDDLMERKKQMMENSDVFVILPGGVGTLDEFFEVLTWKSLRCFDKPILLFNYDGFWDTLLVMMKDLHQKKVLDVHLLNCFTVCQNLQEMETHL